MLLINYKVELELKSTNHFAWSVLSNDNTDVDPNNIISSIKDTKLYETVVSKRQSKTITNSYQRIWKISILEGK